jgi:hypothetical protein
LFCPSSLCTPCLLLQAIGGARPVEMRHTRPPPCTRQPSQALSQGNSCNGDGWNDRDCPDGSMTVCCSPKAAFVYGDDEPLDPCRALWWLTVVCPRLNRHVLKHVSTSLVRNIDMLVDTHVHSSVAATRGLIPRLHAHPHTSERGSDSKLRFRSSISLPH